MLCVVIIIFYRHQVVHVTLPIAMKFALTWEHDTNRRIIGSMWTAEDMQLLKEDFTGLVRKKLSEGKKAKKSDDPNAPIDINAIDFSSTFCKSFDVQISRRLLKAFIENNLSCSRFGYVLDAFDSIQSPVDLSEVLSPLPDLLIEIQASGAYIQSRMRSKLNIREGSPAGKNAKESAAALKSIDQLLASYTSVLSPIDDTISSNESKHLNMSHPLAKSFPSILLRVDGDLGVDENVSRISSELRNRMGANSRINAVENREQDIAPTVCVIAVESTSSFSASDGLVITVKEFERLEIANKVEEVSFKHISYPKLKSVHSWKNILLPTFSRQ